MPVPKNIKVQRCKNQDIKQNNANENQHSLFCMHLGNNLLKIEIIHNHSIPYLFFRVMIVYKNLKENISFCLTILLVIRLPRNEVET